MGDGGSRGKREGNMEEKNAGPLKRSKGVFEKGKFLSLIFHLIDTTAKK
jgi:hypothetical protein